MHLNRGKISSFVNLTLMWRVWYLTDRSPEAAAALDYKSHGYPTLHEFMEASGIVELKQNGDETLVRLKNRHVTPTATAELLTIFVPLPPPKQENPAIPYVKVRPFNPAALEGIRKAIIHLDRGKPNDSFMNLAFMGMYLADL
jgi:hypothetical protein